MTLIDKVVISEIPSPSCLHSLWMTLLFQNELRSTSDYRYVQFSDYHYWSFLLLRIYFSHLMFEYPVVLTSFQILIQLWKIFWWYLNNYFRLHIHIFVDPYITLPFFPIPAFESHNVTETCLVCVKSKKYLVWVTLRPSSWQLCALAHLGCTCKASTS